MMKWLVLGIFCDAMPCRFVFLNPQCNLFECVSHLFWLQSYGLCWPLAICGLSDGYEENGITKVSISIYNESLERMEKMIEMGFKEGFTATLNELGNLLQTLNK